ncbi:MAG: hypothetical protein AB7T06_12085 [Kofleriaceae bacterium]
MERELREVCCMKDELLAIERALWSGGPEAYRRHVDDECLVAFTAMAGVKRRDEVAASVEGGPRWRDLEMELQGLLTPTETVAILTYRARAVRGNDERYSALVSSAYVRRQDGWKLIFHQQTPLD